MERAKLFRTGGSQAVRLPREFRFDGEEVSIRREGDAVILEPLTAAPWPEGYWARLDALGPLPEGMRAPDSLPDTPHRDRIIEEWSGDP